VRREREKERATERETEKKKWPHPRGRPKWRIHKVAVERAFHVERQVPKPHTRAVVPAYRGDSPIRKRPLPRGPLRNLGILLM